MLFYSQLRENIINSITKLTMNDTKSVNQIASVLVEATKEEADITPTSGVSGINHQLIIYYLFLERFTNECLKTKTKVVTLVKHKQHKQ